MRRFGISGRSLSLVVAAVLVLAVAVGAAPAQPAALGGLSSVQIRGADISTLKKNEDKGGVYFDSSGVQRNALDILRSNGMNFARLKIWVNPADGYNNKARVLDMARQIKARGMKLLIDFHYSDTWADPGHQAKPAAWANLSFSSLVQAVYDYTFDVASSLKAQGTAADMVQIGNEINGGMLWPDGSSSNWPNLATLLRAGIGAARAANASTKIMLHIANGGDDAGARWWFDNAVANGVPFDVIGLSHYVYWHGSLAKLQATLNDVSARYNKPVVVAETAYGFTLAPVSNDPTPSIFNASLQQAGGYPATPAGQAQMLSDIFNVVKSVPHGMGLGVFYWEPTWTFVPGSGWDPTDPTSGDAWANQAMFDYNDRALPVIRVFGQV